MGGADGVALLTHDVIHEFRLALARISWARMRVSLSTSADDSPIVERVGVLVHLGIAILSAGVSLVVI